MTPDAIVALGMIDDVNEAEQPVETRLHLVRMLAVPPERVFAAFVDAEQLRRWWGPAGLTVPRRQFDAVEGTDYRIVMQPPDGDPFHIRGTFRAVEAPRRLIYTFIYEEPDPDDQETLVTLTLSRQIRAPASSSIKDRSRAPHAWNFIVTGGRKRSNGSSDPSSEATPLAWASVPE
jgi:uncharacterized protein YndB with AHSA1/START domain